MKLLDNTPNRPFKFGTENWVSINDCQHETYANSHTKFKSLCDYSKSYMLVKVIAEDEQTNQQGKQTKEIKR